MLTTKYYGFSPLHINISPLIIETESVLHEIQHLFIINPSTTWIQKGHILPQSSLHAVYSHHHSGFGKTESISSNRVQGKMLNLPLSFSRELDVLDRAIRTKKDKKTAHATGRSKIIPVCRWHNFIYGKYKDYTKKL